MTATCRSCTRPVLWVVVDKSGASMPIDLDPVDDGNLRLTGNVRATKQGGQAPEIEYVTQESLLDAARGPGDRYVSHFATCPNAEHHRKH